MADSRKTSSVCLFTLFDVIELASFAGFYTEDETKEFQLISLKQSKNNTDGISKSDNKNW